MPQGVPLHIPFLSRISPDVERAQAHHLDWPRSFGLLRTDEAERRHLQGDYAELAGRFHPSASGADLNLGVDQLSWHFIFDDQFDGACGHDPARARLLTDTVSDVFDGISSSCPADAAPFVAALADLWKRSREGMSAAWQARAVGNWRVFFAGYVTEASNRSRGATPSFADQLALRTDTVGVQTILDLAERLGHYEVPEPAYRSPLLTTMRRIAAEVIVLDNDIVSVEKEQAIGDHNLVLALEREGRSRSRAIETIRDMVHERTERFLALERRLTRLCDDLDQAQRTTIDRYRTDALRAVMRGAHDWEQQSDRYTASYISLPVDGSD